AKRLYLLNCVVVVFHCDLTSSPNSAPPQLSEAERIRLTPFERVVYDMAHNEKMVNDLILGRRVGFYELRGEIGQGNFSSVRLGIHALTKGLLFYLRYLFTLPISLCLYICILFYY
uniref:Protein kinase domain-containing protein n=1 Tax=Hippocampus comes TaxID=109280 RepID=A0A3Q3D388_HIPCM